MMIENEKLLILTWVPTALTYLVGDDASAAVLLGGNVVALALYVYQDKIRANEKLMRVLRRIF
jgi:hypothetical protein